MLKALLGMDGRWSLRWRTYVVATLTCLLAWIAGGAAIYEAAAREYEAMCHENLRNLAQTVLSFASHELREVMSDELPHEGATPVHAETVSTLGSRYSYQIWSKDGKLLLRSAHAITTGPYGPLGVAGLSNRVIGGTKHEVFVLLAPSQDMEIHVADSNDEGLTMTPEFRRNFVFALMMSLPPVLGLTWLLMSRAFDALRSTADQLQGRGPADVGPLVVANPPRELEPVIHAINGFVDQAAEELAHQRSFTALAAHELRTPLASMRVQAQVLSRAATTQDRAQCVEMLQDNVDRCARMITQLLSLARADASAQEVDRKEQVRLNLAFADVLSDFAEEVGRRGIDLTCDLQAAELIADPVGLQALLRNLVSNAMRHTPDAGSIRIETRRGEGQVVLSVEDSGDGIPEDEMDNVFKRFYRRAGEGGSGVGLGLAIVASVVRAHRAKIELGRARAGGLKVDVYFPAAV